MSTENKLEEKIDRKFTSLGYLILSLLIGIPVVLISVIPRFEFYLELAEKEQISLDFQEYWDIPAYTLLGCILFGFTIIQLIKLIKKKPLKGFEYGFFVGLIFGLVAGLVVWLILGLVTGLIFGLVTGLVASLIFGLASNLIEESLLLKNETSTK